MFLNLNLIPKTNKLKQEKQRITAHLQILNLKLSGHFSFSSTNQEHEKIFVVAKKNTSLIDSELPIS